MTKNLLILGGHGDIGQAILKKFSNLNYSILSPTSKELNLEDPSSIDRFLSKTILDIDTFIQCAGWNEPKPLEDLSLKDMNKSLAVNLLGFYQIVKDIVPALKRKKEGSIVAISSLYGTFARSKRIPYVTSKHALNGFIKNLALELGPSNIKVNSVSPGFVNTKMTLKNNNSTTIKTFEERIPLGRLANPDEIANVVYFLCSPENSYISGQDIIVDGGYSIGGFQP